MCPWVNRIRNFPDITNYLTVIRIHNYISTYSTINNYLVLSSSIVWRNYVPTQIPYFHIMTSSIRLRIPIPLQIINFPVIRVFTRRNKHNEGLAARYSGERKPELLTKYCQAIIASSLPALPVSQVTIVVISIHMTS